MPVAVLPRLALAFALALSSPLAIAAGEAKRPITAQDLWAVKRVGAPALSPDGARAVLASSSPVRALNHCRSRSISDTSATGVPHSTAATCTTSS